MFAEVFPTVSIAVACTGQDPHSRSRSIINRWHPQSRPAMPHYMSLRSSSHHLGGLAVPSKLKRRVRSIDNNRGVKMSMEAGIGIMATKLGMMSYFEPEGTVVPVTVVGFREGNIITQVKTESTDGYNAVQVGYRRVRDRKLTKPEMGHLQKAGTIPMRHLQEFRLQSIEGFTPNQPLIFSELFNEGDLVDVSGITIGKGFQGLSPIFLSVRCFIHNLNYESYINLIMPLGWCLI